MCHPALVCAQRELFLDVLGDLGWRVNFKKSHLEPKFVQDFVGYRVFSNFRGQPWIQAQPDKVRKLRSHIKRILNAPVVLARKLASVTGQCIGMIKAFVPGQLLLHNIYRDLSQRQDWSSTVALSHAGRSDLLWWFHALQGWNGAPLCRHNIDLQISTDASAIGWGGHLPVQDGVACSSDILASGSWSPQCRHLHSNTRELLAVYRTLQSMRGFLRKKHVQVLSNNVTTCTYLNRLGGRSGSSQKQDRGVDLCFVQREWYGSDSQIPQGQRQPGGRQFIQTGVALRLDTTPRSISAVGVDVGKVHCGSFRLHENSTGQKVQQLFLGPSNQWSGCFGVVRLAPSLQLRQSSLFSARKSVGQNLRDWRGGGGDCTKLERPSLVSQAPKTQCVSPSPVAPSSTVGDSRRIWSGTSEKSQVDPDSLEGVWTARLKSQGWNSRAVNIFVHQWADSTWQHYNSLLQKFRAFMFARDKIVSSPSENDVIEFLVELASSLDRPKSTLYAALAALSHFYKGLGCTREFQLLAV